MLKYCMLHTVHGFNFVGVVADFLVLVLLVHKEHHGDNLFSTGHSSTWSRGTKEVIGRELYD